MIDKSIISRINDAICDEKSKNIFRDRLIYSITSDKYYLEKMISNTFERIKNDDRLSVFSKELDLIKEDVWLFGAGRYAGYFVYFFPLMHWEGVIDSYLEGVSEFRGLPLINFNTFMSDYAGQKILITSKPNYFDMLDQLHKAGITDDNIIDGSFLWDVIEGGQYFDLECLPHAKTEGFVDVGCLDGLSTVAFRKWSGNENDKYFCFEPDANSREKCLKNFDRFNISNYEMYDKGAYNESTNLYFDANGTGESHFIESEDDKPGDALKVAVTKLDDMLRGQNITFIKMDIEGSESNALRGAKEIISEQKPKLAICVYHKPSDIIEIPHFVLSIRPDYRLYFRHYGDNECETVMYAI